MKKLLQLAEPTSGSSSFDQLLKGIRMKGIPMAHTFVQERRIAATLVVVVIALAASSVASSRPSQTTSALRRGTKYISKRYGYEITLQGNYTMIAAAKPWVGDFPFGASGEVDVIADGWHDRKFIVAAKPVSPGTSLRRWEAFVVHVQRQICGGLRNFRSTSLGGEPAREFVNNCPGYEVITLAALHQGRGYLLNYLSPPSANATSERRIYERGRRAFQFTQS